VEESRPKSYARRVVLAMVLLCLLIPAGAMADPLGDVGDDASDAVGDATDSVDDATDHVSDTLSDAGDQASDAVDDATDAAGDAVSDVGDEVDDATGGATDDVTDVVDDVIDDVEEEVDETVDEVTDEVGETIDDTQDAVDETVDEVVEDANDTVDGVIGGGGGGTGGSDPATNPTDQVPGDPDAAPRVGKPSGARSVSGEGSGSVTSGASPASSLPYLMRSYPSSRGATQVGLGGHEGAASRRPSATRTERSNSAGAGSREAAAPQVNPAWPGRFVTSERYPDNAVDSFLHDLADQAAETARRVAFPVALLGIVLAFLAVHGRVDRRDPKLSLAPVDPEEEVLYFE